MAAGFKSEHEECALEDSHVKSALVSNVVDMQVNCCRHGTCEQFVGRGVMRLPE